jgi:hypothetical protein
MNATHHFKPRGKYDVLREIETLEPERDHERIAFLSSAFDFPWDTQRAYELALLRTFAIPKSSSVLVSTGEFTERTQKRYDDTTIIISTIGLCGYSSPEGRAAIRRMNQMHGRYTISNDEFLYVLSTFIYEPVRWNARYGWRPLSETEKLAGFYFWREVGRRMNIRDIPASYDRFEAFNCHYEAEHFAYSPANAHLARVTKELFLSWVAPRAVWPLLEPLIHAVMDQPMRRAFGLPEPPLWAQLTVTGILRLRAYLVRVLPPRRTPYRLPIPKTYPEGYTIEQVGADR